MTTDTPLIRIGSDVAGRDGSLGEVSRVIVDPDKDAISALVVKRGRFLPTEQNVPLSAVAFDQEALRLDMSEDEFDALDSFDVEAYRAPDPDYAGPPGFDSGHATRENLGLATYVALGPSLAFGTATPVGGYPGSEVIRTVSTQPSIGEGADVLTSDGEKVGEVSEASFDPETGQVAWVRVHKGIIFGSSHTAGQELISGLQDGLVQLNVTKAEWEALHDNN